MSASTSFQKIISTLSQSTVDLFFPRACTGCTRPGTLLCQDCAKNIPQLKHQVCYQCQRVTTRFGEHCTECPKTPLDGVFSATCYQVPLMQRLVHLYKYGFIRSLAEPLGIILAEQLEKSALPLPDIALAVPLHPRRLRFRGFNQSELLLQATARHALFPLTVTNGILLRTRYTKPQQKTRRKQERLENLVNAFTITDAASIKGKTVWLFDDVATTHSTLLACATALKQAGAKHVYGIVVASVVR